MPEQITVYKTKDGKLFENSMEADRWERSSAFLKACRDILDEDTTLTRGRRNSIYKFVEANFEEMYKQFLKILELP
jgi:hypothetical protein